MFFGLTNEPAGSITTTTSDDALAVPVRQDWWLPVPYAQQIFSLVPAAAGVLAGLLLAQKFATARATHVKATQVLYASGISFLASFVVVFMIRDFQAYEETQS